MKYCMKMLLVIVVVVVSGGPGSAVFAGSKVFDVDRELYPYYPSW